ncbi:hypothetical protein WJ438_27985 [Streptomyces sp. GD-15H]|uniref:hypothetical protein n=1 Tax=Streptomyces sp. GD-15H TaxID=3129112 RepID=UPI0032458D08
MNSGLILCIPGAVPVTALVGEAAMTASACRAHAAAHRSKAPPAEQHDALRLEYTGESDSLMALSRTFGSLVAAARRHAATTESASRE